MKKHRVQKQPKGQALILIALSFVILLAFVGLTTDVGQLFVQMGHLRRATDAASLAAAGQYREGRDIDEMKAAASEVLSLNGVDPSLYTVVVENCDSNPSDKILCTKPRRKLVRVKSQLAVPMSFLSLVGVNNIKVEAESIGESASLDVVLVIDISESMTWDKRVCDNDDDDNDGVKDDGRRAIYDDNGFYVDDECGFHGPAIPAVGDPDDALYDPSVCNKLDEGSKDGFRGECQPFEEVKRAASNFVNRILDKPSGKEEDRLSIITFANGWSADRDLGTHYRLRGESGKPKWTSNNGEAQAEINNLKVFEPEACKDNNGHDRTVYGPCRSYDDTTKEYLGFDCKDSCRYQSGDHKGEFFDLSSMTTTNIGGGLNRAGNMFSIDTREDALWVVILLSDGMANATDMTEDDAGFGSPGFSGYPLGYCPFGLTPPLCQDKDVSTRHFTGDLQYDADDYARDMADFVACNPLNPSTLCKARNVQGQGAVIFTVGLGEGVLNSANEVKNRPYGATLLRYIAAVGYQGDPDPAKDPCKSHLDVSEWCGNYYFSPEGPELTRIFEDIASRIFTRLTH